MMHAVTFNTFRGVNGGLCMTAGLLWQYISMAGQLMALIIGFITIMATLVDICVRFKNYINKKKQAESDGVVTEDEKKELDELKAQLILKKIALDKAIEEAKENLNNVNQKQ